MARYAVLRIADMLSQALMRHTELLVRFLRHSRGITNQKSAPENQQTENSQTAPISDEYGKKKYFMDFVP
ncbi:MAG: hypothetical protein PHP85_11600 [Gallionella sp.]|nr:hypothetical protein [Gallionella sp.]